MSEWRDIGSAPDRGEGGTTGPVQPECFTR